MITSFTVKSAKREIPIELAIRRVREGGVAK